MSLTEIPVWQIYVLVGLAFIILEVFIPGFVMLPIGVAFVLTSLFTGFLPSTAMQLLALSVNLVGLFLIFQYFIKPRVQVDRYKTNVDAMIGKEVQVVERISSDSSGYVKLYGDLWMAIGLDGHELDPGDVAVIARFEGNKVIVKPLS